MRYQKEMMFDDGSVALTSASATQASPNAIRVPNKGVAINFGQGEPQIIDAQILTTLTGAALTQMTLQLFAAPDNAGVPGTYDTVPLVQADFQAAGVKTLVAGARTQLFIPPLPYNREWLKIQYKGDGTTLTGGKIFATIVPAEEASVP